MASLKILILTFVAAATAAATGAAAGDPTESEYLILDGIIKSALEDLRPSLADLEVPEFSFESETNLKFNLKDGLVEHLEEFVVAKLTSTLLPLRVTNMTLTFDRVKFTGGYSLNGTLGLPIFPTDMKVYGDGDVRVDLKGVFFTIAANFVLKGGKAQIPPNGLYGFDIYIKDCKVDFKNLMGGGETGKTMNGYLSQLVPDLIRDYKFKVFEEIKEPLREMINEALA